MTDIFLHMETLADIGFCYSRHFSEIWYFLHARLLVSWHDFQEPLKSFYWCSFLTLTMVLLITTTSMSNGNFSFLVQDSVFFSFMRHKAWHKSYKYFFSCALKHGMNVLHTNFKILVYPWISKVLKWNNHFRHQWTVNLHRKEYFFFGQLYFEDN